MLRYHCRRGWLDNGEPRCIGFGGSPVDEAIAREILRVVQPAAIEAAMVAHERRTHEARRGRWPPWSATWRRPATPRTGRRSNSMPPIPRTGWWPTNSSDAGTRPWSACARSRRGSTQHRAHAAAEPPPTARSSPSWPTDLEALWKDPRRRCPAEEAHRACLDPRNRRRRRRAAARSCWSSTGRAASTPSCVCRAAAAARTAPTPRRDVEAVRAWRASAPMHLIAGVLNRNGLRTGRGNSLDA